MSKQTSQSQGLLHFYLTSNQLFAIGTMKVKEIVPYVPLTNLPNSHSHVIGSASMRGITVSVVDLAAAVGFRPVPAEQVKSCFIIVVDICRQTVGFLVRKIDKISECRWDDIKPAPVSVGEHAFISGVTRSDDKLIQLLDIEMILEATYPEQFNQTDIELTLPEQALLSKMNILLVDDSATARRQLSGALDSIEVDYKVTDNGKSALDMMELAAAQEEPFQIVVCDIEMPRLDGYELTFEIRSNPKLSNAFVILHTSLSSEISVDRAKQVGANNALTKFDAHELTQAMVKGAKSFTSDNSNAAMTDQDADIDSLL
ncbi:chemotaxis protein [Echinimonas agarilytica]|uniref:Chemotaxis protein n=1 Tax=Echinimonas agarilytica TaxID=1215918 RepID=A0AA41W7Y6_9GAMM|nr:chemotaxis protein [Echinimonas agarilytica]MCM2680308.1 chemotaxis protein [Echinimonas agarilytica]